MAKKRIFTDETFEAIKAMVAADIRTDEIAVRIGCKVTSLKVMCSKRQISLRTPNWRQHRTPKKPRPVLPKLAPVAELPKPIEPPKVRETLTMQSSITLSRVAQSLLKQRAELIGVTEAVLATNLLEVIARDNLFDAIIDTNTMKAA